ncbi:MAG: sterol desaturase family protein [Gammaproteobacteria bacterium]|nr:sterol desaturase family protein [Gammaproteobacteria bacterium]
MGEKLTGPAEKLPKTRWHYRPDLSDQMAPFFRWPPPAGKSLRYLVSSWSLLGARVYVLAVALLSWFYFAPALERCAEFSADWIAQIWLRNFVTMLLVAGSLHLYFYTFNKQRDVEKYDPRDLSRRSKLFHFDNQVWDNMFWTLVSAVAVWSFYESLMMWAYANGLAPTMTFSDNPAWFVLLLFLIPFWTGFHFYWQHRMFHLPALYKLAHNWHHKNTNVGPWSGAAMHPVEHAVWFSAVFVLLLLPSHPLHALFIMQLQAITAVTSHCGYENLLLGKKLKFRLGDFFHQLHHRFYDCNYGTFETPWDQWFDTYHDGSPQGDAWMKQRRRQLTQTKSIG